MRVHVYVDGFNLYRGGLELAGAVTGWKWLDIRALAQTLAAEQWTDPEIARVVYCTSRVKPTKMDADLPTRQDVFLKALRATGGVDHIETGRFIEKVKTRPMATANRKGKPILVTSQPPILVKDASDRRVRDAIFMVSVADREEKGSDVNIATHLLLDALQKPPAMNAAIVISNDSDLKLPVAEGRQLMPLGIVNPGKGYTAGALAHDPAASVPGQWEDRKSTRLN